MNHRATFFLAILCMLGASAPSSADERSERAATLRVEGNRLMDARRFDEALARYEEAMRLTPDDAALYYNLSRVQELRGDVVRALENMEQFAAKASPELKARVGTVDELLEQLRRKVTRVRIECTATTTASATADALARALVLADRQVIANGCSTHDVRLKAGPATFRAEADGYVGRSVPMDLAGGSSVTVRLELAPRDTSGLLRLRTEPEHVDVSVDGRAVGSTPLEIVVPAGSHQFQLAAEGYEPLSMPVVVAANSTKEIGDVHLEKKPSIVTRWWFWTGVGVVVAGGAVLAIALTTERSPDKGTIEPGTAKLPLMRW